jgi:hypothetical protein
MHWVEMCGVGIHRANFADFILDLRNCYSQPRVFVGFTTHKYRAVKSILFFFWREIGLFLVCLTVDKNAGRPERIL